MTIIFQFSKKTPLCFSENLEIFYFTENYIPFSEFILRYIIFYKTKKGFDKDQDQMYYDNYPQKQLEQFN